MVDKFIANFRLNFLIDWNLDYPAKYVPKKMEEKRLRECNTEGSSILESQYIVPQPVPQKKGVV